MLPKNEGPADRAIRIAAGVLLLPIGLFLLGGLEGSVVGLVVGTLGFASLLTGVTGRCLLYLPFGFSTLKQASAAH